MTTFNTLLSQEQFSQFHTAFKALAHARSLTSEDMIVNNVIRGLPEDRGFTAITNLVKIANGADKWHSFKCDSRHLVYLIKHHPTKIKERYRLTDEAIYQIATILADV